MAWINEQQGENKRMHLQGQWTICKYHEQRGLEMMIDPSCMLRFQALFPVIFSRKSECIAKVKFKERNVVVSKLHLSSVLYSGVTNHILILTCLLFINKIDTLAC